MRLIHVLLSLVFLLSMNLSQVSAATNTISIFDTSGTTQVNRPISIARPFRKGNIPNFAQAKINGTAVLTQCDVKNRWADGSLKYAIVSFIIPSLDSNGSVAVEFVDQTSGNNTGFLNQSQMLNAGYNFDATIEMVGTGNRSVSARSMLTNGKFRYWLQGPIVTAVIIEDRTLARTYDQDFGDGSKALHPIFESWFYPQGNQVKVGYTIENIWASNDASKSMRDLSYSITLKAGNTNPTTKWTHSSFNHIGQSRWHKTFRLGSDLNSVRVDHNLDYLITTGAIPHYDSPLIVASTPESMRYSTFQQYNGTLDGSDGGNPANMGNYEKALNAPGANDWIGLQKTWEILWLYSMSERGFEMVLGNADLMGRVPIYLREADSQAGSGNFFDQTWSRNSNLTRQGVNLGTGSIDTFGRIVSINARPTSTFSGLSDPGNSTDKIQRGSITRDGWTQTDSSHYTDACYTAYLFTGRYYYLECLQMDANFRLGWKQAGWNSTHARPGNEGLLNNTNIRTDAWGTKVLVYAAFISPDGEPEQAYFIDKLRNNMTAWEGVQDLSPTYLGKDEIWNWGRNVRTTNLYWAFPGKQPSPLGQWSTGTSAFIQPPLNNNGSLTHATSPWEENFMLSVLGMAKQMEVADTTKLITFMAKKRFHINLDGTPTNLHNFIEAYRDPTIETSTGQWIADFSTFVSHYLPSTEPYTQRRSDLSTDHSYAFIALSADSFLTPYNVDGLSGQDSWNANKANTPHQNRFETQSPKWALTPMPSSVTPTTATLTITILGNGSGTVTSTPSGINCTDGNGTCTFNFTQGASVTLTNSPVEGSTFGGWTGITDCRDGIVTLSVSVSCTATFTLSTTTTSPSLTNPSPGSILSGSSVTFAWAANGTAVEEWWLYVGSSQGAQNILTSGSIPATTFSRNITGLPTSGNPVHVRLWYRIGSTWLSQDFTYTAATGGGSPPTMTTPTPGSMLSGSSETFTWAANGTAVDEWWLYVGSSQGAQDVLTSGSISPATFSRNITGLPTNGTSVWVRLWYRIGSTWLSRDFTYTASNGSGNPTHLLTLTKQGSGSGTVVSNPAGINCGNTCTASYAASTPVTLTATASSGSNIVSWSDGGCNGNSSTCTITLTQNETIIVTFNQATIGLPAITSPTADSILTGTTQTLTWADNGTAVEEWWLYVGSSQGAEDVLTSGSISPTTFSRNITGLPTNGTSVWVRLWYRIGSTWLSQDFTYTAANGGVSAPIITSPSPGSTLSSSSETFTWAANGTAVEEWWLYVGSSQGAKDGFTSGSIPATTFSRNVTGLPTNSTPVWVRLWWRTSAAGWQSADFQYSTE